MGSWRHVVVAISVEVELCKLWITKEEKPTNMEVHLLPRTLIHSVLTGPEPWYRDLSSMEITELKDSALREASGAGDVTEV